MGSHMELSVVVPVYNEEGAVGETLEQLKPVLKASGLSCEIIVVDDGSRDRSHEIIAGIHGVRCLKNPYNLGYGAALKRGIKEAKGEYVLIIDADGSYPVDQIPRLLEHMREYDMVVGSRDRMNVPLARKPAKWLIRRIVNFVSGRPVPDENSGMRVFRRDMAMQFFNLYPDGYSFTITITLASITKGYTVNFFPIDYHKRKGKSHMKPVDFLRFLNLILRILTFFNPFRVFMVISLLMLLLAFAIFLYSFSVLGRVMDITVILVALSALQIFLFGLVADIIIRKD